ncbi:Two component regulator propeller [Chitinophaga sp. CF118]|uniref:sensor histidine kinase n=1 Tax=Chitinophaga sp. CF118 TaxID=1884367 RepID=UPI0008E48A13|nr:histidine kinase [Chitinophaga sp. CF118]SFD64652.1 Two component regulator propeller [Chitinophaga sp. CF118]
MMLGARYIFLWWILVACSVSNVVAQGLLIRNYNVKDGLANATVYSAVQDKEGFIWFSTPTGVSKFDGKGFRNYSKKDGLTDNDVVKLHSDSKGRVWFTTLNGLPSFYSKYIIHKGTNDSTLALDPRGQYMQYMFEDRARYIWFLNTDNHIVQYNDKETKYDKLGALKTDLFYFLRNDAIFTPLQSYFNLSTLKDPNNSDQKILPVNPFPLDDTEFVSRVYKSPVIIIKNSLYSYHVKDVICFFNGADWGIHDEISNICLDNNNLWIGTPRALYYLKDFFKGERKLTRLLDNHYITSLLKDRDGNIWITTFGDGVYNIPYKDFYFNYLDNTNGLYSHSIFSIYKDPKSGTLLVGQNGGMLNTIDSNNVVRQFNLDSTSGRNSILSILPYKNNEMLIGADNGLFTFNTLHHKVTLLKAIKTLKDVDIGTNGKIRVVSKDHLITEEYSTRLPDALVTSITSINDSAYYIGTNAGLLYGTDSMRQLVIPGTDIALHQSIKDLKWINGNLWIGTSDQGIYVLKDNQVIKHLSTADTLVSDICQQLYYDGVGRLYVATNKGVSVIDVNTKKLIRNITSNDGLMSDDTRGVYYEQGMLYIATSNGLSYFSDRNMPVDTIPPVIYLNSVKYGDSTFRPDKDYFVHLYQRKASLEVEFGAIAYDLPELVEYQYNFSSDTSSGWITTMTNIVPFPNLQPETYKLQVRARKYKSDWSKPIAITVTILPRWYQEWWARGILILLSVSLVFFVLRYIVRRIKQGEKRKTEYNRRIAELEAKALTNQMNPHFIFNSLNSVQHLIMEKEEKQALNFLADFATLMRQMLNNSRKSFLSLEEEIAFLTRYIELEKIRFADVFTYQFILDDELKDYTIYIPPMIIQPIVENAIKHGLAPKNGHGRLEVKLILKNDMLYCSVDDDGIGWERANNIKSSRLIKHESTALSVIRERLQIIKSFNGNIGKLEIIDKFKFGFGNKEGTLVEILIPIVKML